MFNKGATILVQFDGRINVFIMYKFMQRFDGNFLSI